MVSVKKKEKEITTFDQLKLKIQLMSQFGFVSFIAVFSISILIILFIQEEVTSTILSDSSKYVFNRVALEMDNVLLQMKDRLQTDFGFIGKFLYQLEQATTDSFDDSTTSPYRIAYTALDPTVTPSILTEIQNQEALCLAPLSSATSAICGLVVSSSNAADVKSCLLQSFIELDDTMSNLTNSVFIKQNIFRVIVQQYQITSGTLNCEGLKVYPAHFVDMSQSEYISGSSFFNEQRIRYYSNLPLNRIMIQGPYVVQNKLTTPSTLVKVLSLSVTWKVTRSSIDYFYNVRAEVLVDYIQDFARTHNYRSYNEIVVLQKKGIFICQPSNWVVPSASSYIFDSNMIQYSGIDQEMYTQLLSSEDQMKVTKLRPDGTNGTYLLSRKLMNDQFDANLDYELYNSEANLSQGNFYILLLYGLEPQQYEVNAIISNLTDKQKYVTIVICIMTSLITLMIVYVATYLVSVELDRPLRVLIGILKQLNNSVQIKQSALIHIKEQLDEQERQSEYQVKDLVISFKSLIETLINRNQSNKNNLKKLTIDYPLNELEITVAKKTKGNQSEFDWEWLINNIQDKSKFSQPNDSDKDSKK